MEEEEEEGGVMQLFITVSAAVHAGSREKSQGGVLSQ